MGTDGPRRPDSSAVGSSAAGSSAKEAELPSPGAEPVLTFERVTLRRGRRTVLSDVDLQITAGSFHALVGPNGSGKSTLLLAVLGTLRPVRGTIRRATGLGDRTAIGFVPQRATLDPALPTTVDEFVDLGLVGLRLSRHERRERVRDALTAVELQAHAGHSFWRHSEGQRQRILLARALARQPRYLLMDEPTASLDPAAGERFWQLVDGLRATRELTVLCATHDLAAVGWVASHALLCSAGRMQVHELDRHQDNVAHLRAAIADASVEACP